MTDPLFLQDWVCWEPWRILGVWLSLGACHMRGTWLIYFQEALSAEDKHLLPYRDKKKQQLPNAGVAPDKALTIGTN